VGAVVYAEAVNEEEAVAVRFKDGEHKEHAYESDGDGSDGDEGAYELEELH